MILQSCVLILRSIIVSDLARRDHAGYLKMINWQLF